MSDGIDAMSDGMNARGTRRTPIPGGARSCKSALAERPVRDSGVEALDAHASREVDPERWVDAAETHPDPAAPSRLPEATA